MNFYKNSNFKNDTYFRQTKFKNQLNEAKKHGKDVLYNEIRKINNCKHARNTNGEISIQDIFVIYWDEFKEKYKYKLTRPGIIQAIDNFVSCHNFEKGYLFLECPNCNNFHMIGFSCHSRCCPSCGKKYRDQRTIKVSQKCISVPHRQFVFTIPEKLRIYFRKYRELLNVLFASVSQTLNASLSFKAPLAFKKEKRRLGFISFLHTFGRDLKWHPHIHVLLAERYLNKFGEIKKNDYISFDFLRITFQNILFHNIYLFFKNTIKNYKLSQQVYKLLCHLKKVYPNGYYVYGRKFDKGATTTKDIKQLTNYIARYASHPPIAESRITNLDTVNNLVTWFYDPHEDDDIEDEEKKIGRQYVTQSVFEFMSELIKHIPNKGFQQIRYYGFYSNKFKNKVNDKALFSKSELSSMTFKTFWANNLKSSYGFNPTLCFCGNIMFVNHDLSFYPKRGPT